MHLKHHKILYLRTSSTNFQLVKGTSLERNLLVSGEKWHFWRGRLWKKDFPETDFTARKVSRAPECFPGSLHLYKAGALLLQAPAPLEQLSSCCPCVLGWRARAELHPLHLPALLLGPYVPEEIWPAAQGQACSQPSPHHPNLDTSWVLQLGTWVKQPKSSPSGYWILTRKKYWFNLSSFAEWSGSLSISDALISILDPI